MPEQPEIPKWARTMSQRYPKLDVDMLMNWVTERHVTPDWSLRRGAVRTLADDLLGDHFSGWKDKQTRKGRIVVSHPYSVDEVIKIVHAALEFRFECHVYPPARSWYYPGQTYMVEVFPCGVCRKGVSRA